MSNQIQISEKEKNEIEKKLENFVCYYLALINKEGNAVPSNIRICFTSYSEAENYAAEIKDDYFKKYNQNISIAIQRAETVGLFV